jgi:hypothetical protein
MCTLTPNLERLDLTIGEKDLKDLEYLYILLMQKDLVPPYLSKLRSLEVRGSEGQIRTFRTGLLLVAWCGPGGRAKFCLSWR